MPDEAVYSNIARSIAEGGGIALRNQALTYTNLLYPLLLSPVYLLFPAGAQFRAIQLVNCLLMSLSVFPAYGIAKKLSLPGKTAFGIALLSIFLPDMLMASRVMTEAIEYPLFLWAVYLMFGVLSGEKANLKLAALIALAAFLLSQAKAGMIALAVMFLAVLICEWIRSRDREKLYFALAFAGVYAVLTGLFYLMLALGGMDFTQQTIYQAQTQAPGLEHLKKTLPGLLLYAFFIPVAFGVYPLLIPASNLKAYDAPKKKMLMLTLFSLILCAAGACYLFFDTETIGDYFQGRIHIRYVFAFFPVLLAFAFTKEVEGTKPNGKLLLGLGFLAAMITTVSFSALLSNRQYCVDAIMLSYLTHDDASLDWTRLSQIASILFTAGILLLLYDRGWDRWVKKVFTVVFVLGLLTANVLGYDLNRHNDDKALSADAKEVAGSLEQEKALLVPDGGIYFDNTLSVLDIAMKDSPYFLQYGDLCAVLGDYGALESVVPPQYWTEKPDTAIGEIKHVVFNYTVFNSMVLADGAQSEFSQNGYYAVVTLPEDGRLFHSALTGIEAGGRIAAGAALYIYDEELLAQETIRVYLNLSCGSGTQLTLTANGVSYAYTLDETNDWIYADIPVPAGSTGLKVAVEAVSGSPLILTYSVE